MARDAVEAGQGNFEFFKPLLLSYLPNIAALGNVEFTKRCSESITHLEEDLKVLQDLECVSLESRIESVLAEARVQAMRRLALLQKDLDEKELQVTSLKAQCDLREAELSSMASTAQATQGSIATIRETITELQAELARQEEKLSQENAAVESLTRESTRVHQDYSEAARALSVALEEFTAATPNEEALRREATVTVQTAHEREVAEVRARLASISLPRPAA